MRRIAALPRAVGRSCFRWIDADAHGVESFKDGVTDELGPGHSAQLRSSGINAIQ